METHENKNMKKKPPMRKIPASIVTKDTNNAADLPLELSRELKSPEELSLEVEGFLSGDSDDYFDDTPYSSDYPSSSTIDGSMLPRERFKRKKPRRSKSTTLMLLDEADRFFPEVETGLSLEQVESRTSNGLVNFTKKKSSKSLGRILFHNLVTPINIIAAIVATALIIFDAEISQLFFLVIILINLGIGIFQEIRAKLTVERLSIMTAPTAVVVRGGEKYVVPVSEVVLDDVMYIEAGRQICADSIMLEGDVEAYEALLTGESIPERKTPGSNLYSGSFLSSGSCYARVNKVGSANYVETLTSHARKYKKPKSELFNSINFFIRLIIPLAVVLSVATILMHYFRVIRPAGLDEVPWDMWVTNISQAAGVMIGMLPVGMFLLTSTALFVSVIRLGKKRALVKDFNCIESLARVDVLCLDKTGTITDGSMSVKEVVPIKGMSEVPHELADIVGSILTATGDNNQTARALADKFGYSKMLVPKTVLPFSSQRKLAAVTFEDEGTFIYGAPEFVLKDVGVRIDKLIGEHARQGYRVLVVAHSPAPIVNEKLPVVRRPLCLLVIEDFIREDAFDTISWFKANDVKVKVISGDNPITVSEVARRVGVEKAELYISLEGLSEREVLEAAPKYTVFGRVTPEQKKLLVQALKQKGHTVAMTGDGVNDILAMRESDCAVAIASGSEAARNIAHLVLQDNSFSSMPSVVLEGRRVINNIQKTSALFLMKTIMTVILAVVFLFLETRYPYDTNHLLLMELFVIGLASLALAMQANTNPIKGKFLSNVIGRSAPGGITLAVSMLAIYFYANNYMYAPYGYDAIGSAGYVTMLVLGVTFTSFIVLIKFCEPPDMFRVVLLISVGALLALGALVVPLIEVIDLFSITPGSMAVADTLFLIVAVLGSYFFMSVLIKVMKALKILNY